jgi:Cupin
VDVLSDVLLAVRLTGAVFFDVDARSPFATESPGVDTIGEQVMGGADRVIGFHVVTDGTCWAETVDGPDPPVRLHAGDMVIFPAGDANIIASAPGMRGAPDAAQYYRPVDRLLPFALTAGRDAARTGAGSSAASWAATPARSTRCSRRCRASSALRSRRRAGAGSPTCWTRRWTRPGRAVPAGRRCSPSSPS